MLPEREKMLNRSIENALLAFRSSTQESGSFTNSALSKKLKLRSYSIKGGCPPASPCQMQCSHPT